MIGLKTSLKFIFTSLLLCLALLLTGFTATGTIQAYQHFQQDHQGIQHGDVTTVRPWMTIPYISYVYSVPQPCFIQSLHLTDHSLVEHATLRVLADHYQLPLKQMINDVQNIILSYRRKELNCGPSPMTTTQTGGTPPPFSPRKGIYA